MPTVRSQLVAILKPLLPNRWKIIPYATNIDAPTVPIVMFQLQQIEPTKEAPRASWTFTFALYLIVGHTDPEKAEDALDGNVETLWKALSGNSHLNPTIAKKVKVQELWLAYEITLEIIGDKE